MISILNIVRVEESIANKEFIKELLKEEQEYEK